MKKDKKIIEIRKDEKEPVVVPTQSQLVKEFKAIIEAYKEQNPVKYAMKKDALEAKLKSLK